MNYSISNNIGFKFKHLFRCVQCDTLLKLDEEYVELIYREEHGEEPEQELATSEIVEEGIEDEYSEEEYLKENHTEEQLIEEDYEQVVIGESILNSLREYGCDPGHSYAV